VVATAPATAPVPDAKRVRRRLDAVRRLRQDENRRPTDRDARAADALRELLPDVEHLHGPDARETLGARLTLAESVATNDPEDALTLLEELIPHAARALGRRDRTTLTARLLLTSCTRRTGDDDRATWVLRQLTAELESAGHQWSDRARVALHEVHHGYRPEQVSVRTLRRALGDLTAVGADDTQTGVELRTELAWALSRDGEPFEALEIMRAVVPRLNDDHQADDWPQLIARYQLGEYAAESGETAEATDVLHAVILDASRALGPSHWLTVTACESLGALDEAAEERVELVDALRTTYGARRTRKARRALLGD
ncbi:hypothetical protein, partial [Streptomyces sp. 8K308]|uniref:hypothetical protein n=1 Tax=Streptomyces sp. 8K308 TaxID=2530388 RepID=UPI0014052116